MTHPTHDSAVLGVTTRFPGHLTQLWGSLSTRLANYLIYRATVAELLSLSDDGLKDVGLRRSEIHSVAFRSNYKA